MKRTINFVFAIWAALVIVLAMPRPAHAAMINSRAALMVDADTGQLIYQQNIDQKLPVASVSKLLTACVIEDEVAAHQLSWQQKIKISPAIVDVSNDKNYSAIGLHAGQSYTVRDLFVAMMVKSADGAALALATANGQSIKLFNAKMVKKAKQIGVNDATIVNSVGLRNCDLKKLTQRDIKKQTENTMTARDVAMITRYLIHHYPDVLQVTKRPQQSFTIAPGKVVVANNSNLMLSDSRYRVPNVAIDGLKTGTSDQAGACFVSTGVTQGHRIITVVLHANGGGKDRFIQTQQLYRYLQSNVHPQKVTLNHQQAHPAIVRGTRSHVAVGVNSLTIWQGPKDQYRLKIHYRQQLTNSEGQLVAPVKKDQRLGTATVKSKTIKTIDNKPLTVKLHSKQTVKRQGLFN